MKSISCKRFSFLGFELDEATRQLKKDYEIIDLTPKRFDLLLVLVKNHGRVLSKDELLEIVWKDQFVEENNLTVHISALRKMFKNADSCERLIVTLPGHGYKFVGEVKQTEFQIALAQSDPLLNLEEFFANQNNLIGRETEIAAICDLLCNPESRLITLTGAGGTGKTCLAETAAKAAEDYFSDGVIFVELVSVSDPILLLSAIANALELHVAGLDSISEAIKNFLSGKRILIVLDNFEQIILARNLVKELVSSSSLLKILITSRRRLNISEELEFLVSPLSFPPPDSSFAQIEIDEFSAVSLFISRAKQARPGITFSNKNFPSVIRICQKLEGMPLAIELAAARIKLLSPESILERLDNSLKLLKGGSEELPKRQRTMRETIVWSYELLGEEEKAAFRRLAVFAGGFLVESAELILGEHSARNDKKGSEDTEIIDILNSLIDNSLLSTQDGRDGNVRLRMLQVVHEFASEMLEECGESEEFRVIHSQYFLTFAEEAESHLSIETSEEWLQKLESDHDNFRAALKWSLKNDGDTAVRIAGALRYFWLNRGYLSEGLDWTKKAIGVSSSRSKARSKLLLANGLFLRDAGDFEGARKIYEKCLSECIKTEDRFQLVKVNHGLSAIAVMQKDFALAVGYIEEALAVSRQLNDEILVAYSLCAYSDLEICRERLSPARQMLEECLLISRAQGLDSLLSTSLYNLGTIETLENNCESAAANFTESMQLAKRMGNKTLISCAIDGIAAVSARRGEQRISAYLAGAAEGLRDSIGYKSEPAEVVFREDYLAKVTGALIGQEFRELYSQGRLNNSDQTLIQLLENGNFTDDSISEIIIERHTVEHIVIDEEI